jgi:hypothetical protein
MSTPSRTSTTSRIGFGRRLLPVWWILASIGAASASEALPAYTLEAPGLGRGDAKDPTLTLLVGGKIQLLVRPASPAKTTKAILAVPYWMKGGDARPWNAKAESLPDGTVSLRGTVDNPFSGDIEAELAVVVARAGGKLPTPAQCQPPACLLLRRPVHYVLPILPAPAPPPADPTPAGAKPK